MPSTPSPGSARPLVVANPAAGRGRHAHALDDLVAAVLAATGPAEVALTAGRGDAERLAAAAARDGRPLVVGVGGDGTISELANGLVAGAGTAAERPVLGVVSTGTGGDYGRSLGIPHERAAYLAVLRAGAPRLVDVGRARFAGPDGATVERAWLNVLSAGIGGLVDRYAARAPAALGGRFAYGQAAVRAIFACRRVRLRCRYEDAAGDPQERILDAHAVAVCNGRVFGGGMNIAPMARLDDGRLEVVAFETSTRLRLLARFLTVYRGTHLDEPGVNHFSCRSLELQPADPPPARRPRAGLFPLDVDGDALGDVPVRITLERAALRVLAPAG